MGWVSGVVGKIRQFFRSDKLNAPERVAKGATADDMPTQQRTLFWGLGTDNYLNDWLYVDRNLVARNIDYEEMDDYPELSTALDIFADDSTQPDTQTMRTVWVTAPDKRVQEMLDVELLQTNLRIDEEIWEIARTLCKYGQDYEEMLVSEDGVVGLNYLPVPTVRRIEDIRGTLLGFVQDFKEQFQVGPEKFIQLLRDRLRSADTVSQRSEPTADNTLPMAVFEPWEVVHFRMRTKERRSVYGMSVLEPARWVWRRLTLLEDSAVLFRLTKAVERYAFYIDVGNMPPREALHYVNTIKQKYRKKQYVNPATSKLELRNDPLNPAEDFFVPARNGQASTRIETVTSPQWQHMDDVEYFRDKLFAAIKIPKAYLGQEMGITRAALSSEDVRFARTVLRVQRALRHGVETICRVHLMAKGVDPASTEFRVWMTVPSAILELAQIEVKTARADLASRMGVHFSIPWLLANVYNIPEDDIPKIIKEREEDIIRETAAAGKGEALAQQAMGAAMGGEAPVAEPGAGGGAEPEPEAGEGAVPEVRRSGFRSDRRLERSSVLRSRALNSSLSSDAQATAQMQAAIKRLLANDRSLSDRIDRIGKLLHDIRVAIPPSSPRF